MRVAAFDVGVKNLAWCVLGAEGGIEQWRNVALAGKTIEDNVRSLHHILAKYASDFDVDVVVVERQMATNTRMSCLGCVLLAHFLDKIDIVEFVEASSKMGAFCDGPLPKVPACAYRKNKAASVARVRACLEGRWLELFEAHAKRDDLADAYALALAYSRRHRRVVV